MLLAGGDLPEGIEPPRGVEIVALPPLGVNGGTFGSGDPRYSTERAWEVRAQRITATLHDVKPSVVLVELFPFGRAKFARELVPLLEQAKQLGATTACSLRDILVSTRTNQQEHDDRAARLANAHLDLILVHCDPRFARLEETFKPRVELTVPVRYTGLRHPQRPRASKTAASTSSSRRAAGASAGRCSKRRSRPPAAARCARSRAR